MYVVTSNGNEAVGLCPLGESNAEDQFKKEEEKRRGAENEDQGQEGSKIQVQSTVQDIHWSMTCSLEAKTTHHDLSKDRNGEADARARETMPRDTRWRWHLSHGQIKVTNVAHVAWNERVASSVVKFHGNQNGGMQPSQLNEIA